jgi:hypothetical protein
LQKEMGSRRAPAAACRYLAVEEAAPPLPLVAAAPLPLVPLLDAAPPLMPPLPVPPVAPELPASPLGLELGVLGAVAVDDEDDPPGTTTVSRFSVVVDDDADPLGVPPGTTVVVSLRSHAERANAPTTTNSNPLRFMSTLLSFDIMKAPPPRATCVPVINMSG